MKDRLAACWSNGDCKSCLRDDHRCGWCPNSGTCVPTEGLLQPIVKHDVCPLRSERFELRTRALGCGCSTTTLLSIVVTIPATLLTVALLYFLIRAIIKLNAVYGTGSFRGWEIKPEDRSAGPWRRSKLPLVSSWFKTKARYSEQEILTERSRLMS